MAGAVLISRVARAVAAVAAAGLIVGGLAVGAAWLVASLGNGELVAEPIWPASVVAVETSSHRDWFELDNLTVVNLDIVMNRWDVDAIRAAIDYASAQEDPYGEAGSIVIETTLPANAHWEVELALPIDEEELSAALREGPE